MRIVTLIVILSSFFASIKSHSQTSEVLSLDAFELFIEPLFDIKCSQVTIGDSVINDESKIASQIGPIIVEGIYEGLKKIERINPTLISIIINNIRGKHLEITCSNTDELFDKKHEVLVGEMVPLRTGAVYSRTFDKELNEKNKIEHGDFFSEVLSALAPEKQIYSTPEFLNYRIKTAVETLFHEFLHFARVDNLSMDVHNDPLKKGGGLADSVYSCSTYAFKDYYNFPQDLQKTLCESCARVREKRKPLAVFRKSRILREYGLLPGMVISSKAKDMKDAKQICSQE